MTLHIGISSINSSSMQHYLQKMKVSFCRQQEIIMIYNLFAVLLVITSSLQHAGAQECYREDHKTLIIETGQTTRIIFRDDELYIFILGFREVQVSGKLYDVYGIRQCGNNDIELEDPRVQTCNSRASNPLSAIYFSCMDLFNEGDQQTDIQLYAYSRTASDSCLGSDFKFLLINTTGS